MNKFISARAVLSHLLCVAMANFRPSLLVNHSPCISSASILPRALFCSRCSSHENELIRPWSRRIAAARCSCAGLRGAELQTDNAMVRECSPSQEETHASRSISGCLLRAGGLQLQSVVRVSHLARSCRGSHH